LGSTFNCNYFQAFVGELRGCLEKFKELNMKIKELMKLRLEAIEALSESLKKESQAEHERSYLLESYGALIQAIEEKFQRFSSTS